MKSIFLLTAVAAAVLLSSCNTMIGLGRDMKIGGEGIENTAGRGGASGAGGGDTSGAPVY